MQVEKEQLRELYKETFGKYPSGNTKTETIVRLLKNEGVEVGDEEPEDEPKKENPKAEEPKEEAKAKKLPPTNKKSEHSSSGVIPKHEGMPVHEGRGAKTRYLVIFRGKPRYWTHASIMSMRSVSKDVVFPENTTYQNVAQFQKCKSC